MQYYNKKDDIRELLNRISSLKKVNEEKSIPIPKDERFGNTVDSLQKIVISQLQGIQVKFEDNSIFFYPKDNDIIMSFSIPDLNNMIVNFKLNDSNGQGCYISCNNTQLNDDNVKYIQRLKYSFDTWKKSLIEDDSIINNIKSSLLK